MLLFALCSVRVRHPKQNLVRFLEFCRHYYNLFLVYKRCVIDSLLQGGELGLTGKMKRSAILEKHAACIASMFVHKSKHTYNSMCEASTAAIQDVKNHAPHQLLTQVIDLSILCRFLCRIFFSSRQNSPFQNLIFFTKFTISKSHFSQNSHFQSLIFSQNSHFLKSM